MSWSSEAVSLPPSKWTPSCNFLVSNTNIIYVNVSPPLPLGSPFSLPHPLAPFGTINNVASTFMPSVYTYLRSDHKWKEMQYLCFWDWLNLPGVILSNCIHFFSNGTFLLFGWKGFRCVYIYRTFFPSWSHHLDTLNDALISRLQKSLRYVNLESFK